MPSNHAKRSSRKGESANHLLSFQFRPPQSVVSTSVGPAGGHHRVARQAPCDPEKLKIAHRLLALQYLVYPDVAAAAMHYNYNATASCTGQPSTVKYPDTPTTQSVLSQKPQWQQQQQQHALQTGREAAKAMLGYDAVLSWDYVYAVTLRSDSSEDEGVAGGVDVQCPICLEAPCAPRITPCGHIYCLPCILRFLNMQKEEGHPRTCPVCHAMLVSKQLKRVLFQSVSPLREGTTRTFVLVHRQKQSPLLFAHTDKHLWETFMQPTPQGSCDNDDGGGASTQPRLVLPRYDEDASSAFGRYSIATQDVHGLHQVLDESALEERRMEFVSSVSTTMTPEELLELKSLDESIGLVQRYAFEYALTRQQHSLPATPLVSSPSQPRERLATVTASSSQCEATSTRAPASPTRPAASPPTTSTTAPSGGYPMYDLYMDSGGQPIFLHFVCTKMILDDCRARGVDPPSTIEVTVLDIESVTQTEQSRSVLKPLAYIPLSGTIRTVFCEMKSSGLVGPHTMKAFKEVIDRRLQRIAERQREKAARNETAASMDDAWEAHKARRRQSNPTWRDATPPQGGVSPTMEAYAQPEDLPALESLPPAAMSCHDTARTSSTEHTSWSIGGPSDSSLETRQRATKGRCDDITDALTASNLSEVHPTPPPSLVGAWAANGGMTTELEPSSSSAAVRLFASGPKLPQAAPLPTWGGKPFVDRSAKGSVYNSAPLPRVETQPMVDDDDAEVDGAYHEDPFEELDAIMRARVGGGGGSPAGAAGRDVRGGKKKKSGARAAGKTTSLTAPSSTVKK